MFPLRGQVVPVEGARKVCTPEAVKVDGLLNVQRAVPGEPKLLSFRVTVRSLPAVPVFPMVWNAIPMDVTV